MLSSEEAAKLNEHKLRAELPAARVRKAELVTGRSVRTFAAEDREVPREIR
jgi:hypothetical protein